MIIAFLIPFTLSCLKVDCKKNNGIVKDIDGNIYQTVIIGEQEWMAENLRTTHLNDGTIITEIKSNYQWFRNNSPAYCYYDNDTLYGRLHGALYNWYTINTNKLCPVGWHVPNEEDWHVLINFLGGIGTAGRLMKSREGWQKAGNGNNESGFSGLPGGLRYSSSFFLHNGHYGYWWSYSREKRSAFYLLYDYPYIFQSSFFPNYGLSVRCVKDNDDYCSEN